MLVRRLAVLLHRVPYFISRKRPWFSSRVCGISCIRERRAVRAFRSLVSGGHQVYIACRLFNSHHVCKPRVTSDSSSIIACTRQGTDPLSIGSNLLACSKRLTNIFRSETEKSLKPAEYCSRVQRLVKLQAFPRYHGSPDISLALEHDYLGGHTAVYPVENSLVGWPLRHSSSFTTNVGGLQVMRSSGLGASTNWLTTRCAFHR